MSLNYVQSNSSMFTEYAVETVSDHFVNLYIRFKGGKLYRYCLIDSETLRGFLAESSEGGSMGRYLNSTIKPNFQCEQL